MKRIDPIALILLLVWVISLMMLVTDPGRPNAAPPPPTPAPIEG